MRKLVRDKIPLLFPKGKYRTLSQREYARALLRKLDEETKEYKRSRSLEELADILEVLHALALLHKANKKKLEAERAKKAKLRGMFTKRVLLVK